MGSPSAILSQERRRAALMHQLQSPEQADRQE